MNFKNIKTLFFIDDKIKKIEFGDLNSILNIEDGLNLDNKVCIYFLIECDNVYFSYSLAKINTLRNLEFSDELVSAYLEAGFVIPPFTIYENVYMLPFYSKLDYKNSILNISIHYPNQSSKYNSIEEFESDIKSVLFQEVQNSKKLLITLSGGADSSLLYKLSEEIYDNIESVTCVMDGFEKDVEICQEIVGKNEHTLYNPKKHIKEYGDILKNYIKKNHIPVYDPIYPVYQSMIHNCVDKDYKIVDGQGADSLLIGLPHNILINAHIPLLSPFFKLLSILIPTMDKSTSIGRKFYRLKKLTKAISFYDWRHALLNALDMKINDTLYKRYVLELLNEVKDHYGSKHKATAYLFLFRITHVREMQKYEGLHEQMVFPFFNQTIISKVFSTQDDFFISGRNVKKPIYCLLDKYLPNKIQKNRTSPFFVNYKLNLENNIYKQYKDKKITDKELKIFSLSTLDKEFGIKSNKDLKIVTIVYNTTAYVYKFRINLIREIEKFGYKVIVLSPKDEYVKKLNELGIEHHHINMSQYGMNPIKELKTIYELYKAFKKYKPIYSLHYTIKPNIFGSIAATLSGASVINNIAGAGKAFSNDGLFQKFTQLLYKIGLKTSQKVFFQNNDDMNLFLDNNLVKREKAYRIPGSGVDLTKYEFKLLEDNKNIDFLFIGRLLKEKGIIYFLEAAKIILEKSFNAKFYIVGEHEKDNLDYIDKELLDQYLELKGIHYYGSVSPDAMPKIIGDSTCVVLPSYYREGVPRSLLESAAMGKPIITTKNVGCKEVVDEGKNGYKCEVKDSKCLSEKMIQFINLSFDNKLKMSKYGRNKMEKEFEERIVLEAYIKELT